MNHYRQSVPGGTMWLFKFIYLSNRINSVSRDSFVNSKLVIGAILIDETSEDIETAINDINARKHGIIHPQILTPPILKSTLQEFEEKHHCSNDTTTISVNLHNFRCTKKHLYPLATDTL